VPIHTDDRGCLIIPMDDTLALVFPAKGTLSFIPVEKVPKDYTITLTGGAVESVSPEAAEQLDEDAGARIVFTHSDQIRRLIGLLKGILP
jgi:hypothetical protein